VTDLERLDRAKRAYLAAKRRIEDLRQKIGRAACPLKVGDRVFILDDTKEYEGIVEGVEGVAAGEEMLDPIVGVGPAWVAHGHRSNKTTGQLGAWSFSITNEDTFQNGKWVKLHQTFEEKLGLN